jgi:hypothetical protein
MPATSPAGEGEDLVSAQRDIAGAAHRGDFSLRAIAIGEKLSVNSST